MIPDGLTYSCRTALADYLKDECIALDPTLANNPRFGWDKYDQTPSIQLGTPYGYIVYPVATIAEQPQASYDSNRLRRRFSLVFRCFGTSHEDALRQSENWLDVIAANNTSIMRKLAKTGLPVSTSGIQTGGKFAGCRLINADIGTAKNQDDGGEGVLRLEYEYPDFVL